ncbi:MAG: hypothetical protein HOY69_16420 [Streptomyces sp.]|nr:hypothetical protein [Streptomyces sp.]
MAERLDPLDAALLAAWNASEPEGPECHVCGRTTGPWVPDPSGDRWPSGAQRMVFKGGCPGGPAPVLDVVEGAGGKGLSTTETPGGRRLDVLAVRGADGPG